MKQYCFQLTKNLFSLARKSVCISQNMLFLLKLTSTSFSDGFHLEEKPLNKRKLFLQARNPFLLAGMKDFVEKQFFARRKKKLPLVGISEKQKKNGFHQPENQLSTCSNNLPLAGIFLKKWIPPNFNNAFHKQEGSCRIRAQPE